jgi:hypothetical protein
LWLCDFETLIKKSETASFAISLFAFCFVPGTGLEPAHPCEY